MNSQTNLKQRINDVLASWNPIGVPDTVSHQEYESYIESVIAIGNDAKALTSYLKTQVRETMGLDYDDENPTHRGDIEIVVKKLIENLSEEA